MDELNQSSCNPYAHIDNDADDGHASILSTGSVPHETSPRGARVPSSIRQNGGRSSAGFNLEAYANALGLIPSGNPCACTLDSDEEIGSAENLDKVPSTLAAIDRETAFFSADKNFANPYRHIDNESSDQQPYFKTGMRRPWETSAGQRTSGQLPRAWAHPFTSAGDPLARARKGHSDQQIEEIVRSIQRALWEQRSTLSAGTHDPIQVLNPEKVLELYGYVVRYRQGGLGHDKQAGVMVEVAGLIDPASKVVEISMLTSPMERLFTLAHELGHVALGSAGTVVHRDRSLNGTRTARDFDERSADKFAAYFLMPRKPLKQLFKDCYLTDCFKLSEETGFALRASSLDVVREQFPTLRKLSCYLSTAEHYNGRGFRSLASIFKVSELAMAIRLEELGLVK